MNPSAEWPPRVSVVICTRERPLALRRCLTALSQQATSFPFTIIVVDNSPDGKSTRECSVEFHAQYVAEARAGHNRARNAGLRSTTADIVAFTDDDTVPAPDWLESLTAPFADPAVAATTGRIDGGTAVLPDLALFQRMEPLVIDNSVRDWFAMTNFGGAGNGANMAFRREALLQIGGFDERLGLGSTITSNDEHEAFFQIVERGSRLVYNPAAVLVHVPPKRDIGSRATEALTGTIAYMLLLFFEQPRYRRALLRYGAEGIMGRPRRWRASGAASPLREATSPLPVSAARALLQYVGARSQQRIQPAS